MQQQNPGYVVKRTNAGLGLFATKPIARGKRIIEYKGPLVLDEVVYRGSGKYFFGVDSKWSIDGSARSNIARYINHSCKPNAEALISGRRVWIWSRKNIKVGEEIVYDYGKDYFEGIIEPLGCRCKGCGATSKRSQKKPAVAKVQRKKRRKVST